MKATTEKKRSRAGGSPWRGGSSKKKTPRTGVVTRPDGTQYLEEKMEGADFEDRADKLASLVTEHAKVGEEIAKIKSDKASQLRDAKGKLAKVEERMGFLGYEVKNRVKKVLRQQTLPKVNTEPPAKGNGE